MWKTNSWLPGGKGVGGINWEIGVDIHYCIQNGGFSGGSDGKNLLAMQKTRV